MLAKVEDRAREGGRDGGRVGGRVSKERKWKIRRSAITREEGFCCWIRGVGRRWGRWWRGDEEEEKITVAEVVATVPRSGVERV